MTDEYPLLSPADVEELQEANNILHRHMPYFHISIRLSEVYDNLLTAGLYSNEEAARDLLVVIRYIIAEGMASTIRL